MTSTILARLAVKEDAAELLSLRQVVFAETEYMLWEPGEFKDSIEDERKRIERLNAGQNSRCLVAVADGTLIGFLNAMGSPVNRLRHATTLALGVRRSHWSCGAGSALLTEALSWSNSAGLIRVELAVHTTNQRAVALYQRHGFEVEGTKRRSLLVNGRYVDEHLMAIITNAA